MRLNINTSLTNGRPNGRKSPDEAKKSAIKFLVGNRIHKCPKTILSKYPESHLAKLVGAASVKSTQSLVDLWEITDRSSELFELVVKLMEHCCQDNKKAHGPGDSPIDLSDPDLRDNLLKELSFYNLPSLSKLVVHS